MRKAAGHFGSVLERMVRIGLGVQIVLGICWLAGSFMTFQEFGDSFRYLEASQSLHFDADTGILYPLFLLCAKKLSGAAPLPYYVWISALQLGISFGSGCFFWKNAGWASPAQRSLGSLALMTIPAVMQCHAAVLPNSLALSALLAELGCFAGAVAGRKRGGERKTGKICACMAALWVAQILLIPDWLLFGAAPLLIWALSEMIGALRKKDKKWVQALLLLCLCVGLCLGFGRLIQKAKAPERAKRTPGLLAASRFAGSCLEDTYGYWPEDLQACLSDEELRESVEYADNIRRIFGKKAQESLGIRRADEAFWQVAKAGYQVYYRQVQHDLVWDLGAYAFSPFFLQLQLQGRGCMSYSGRNYDIMRMRCPRLTAAYVDYGSWWFVAGLALSCLCILVRLLRFLLEKGRLNKQRLQKALALQAGDLAVGLCMLAVGMGMMLWYTMQGFGIMDYKNTLFVVCMWTALMCRCAGRMREDNG